MFQSFLAVQPCIANTLSRLTMANSIHGFMDNMRLNTLTSLTHLLNFSDTDELNIIQHLPYMSDKELIRSRIRVENGLNTLSLHCQSLHAKFDDIKLITEEFMSKNCPLQVICLQETWFASNTDLSLYEMPEYHMINTGRCASNHGGLLIYLNKMWTYKIRNCVTDSKIWEKQIIEIFHSNTSWRRGIIFYRIQCYATGISLKFAKYI